MRLRLLPCIVHDSWLQSVHCCNTTARQVVNAVPVVEETIVASSAGTTAAARPADGSTILLAQCAVLTQAYLP